MLKRIAIFSLVLTVILAVGHEGIAWAAKQRSTAKVRGFTGLKATVNYESQKKNGKKYARMVVSAKNGMPFGSYSVYVNGNKVGDLGTNVAGKGKLDLRSAALKKSKKSKPMPGWLKNLKKGDVVMVGSSCGIAYKCDHDGTQKFKLAGEAFGEAGEHATVTYCEKFNGSELDRRFFVDLSGAAADSSYDVWVDGQFVATIIADFNGAGSLELRTAAFIPDGSTAQPMPDTFPTLQAGSTCSVGSMTITLEQANKNGGDGDSSDDDSSSSDDDSVSSDDDSVSSDDGSSDGASVDGDSGDDGSDDGSDGSSGSGSGDDYD